MFVVLYFKEAGSSISVLRFNAVIISRRILMLCGCSLVVCHDLMVLLLALVRLLTMYQKHFRRPSMYMFPGIILPGIVRLSCLDQAYLEK